jgi:hypothetical protein
MDQNFFNQFLDKINQSLARGIEEVIKISNEWETILER